MSFVTKWVEGVDDVPAFVVKWVASVLQIIGYTFTGLGWTPWNVYLFFFGIIGWFVVGVRWNDRALMLVHLVAFIGLIGGHLSR